jgi:hypothetical protein
MPAQGHGGIVPCQGDGAGQPTSPASIVATTLWTLTAREFGLPQA